MKLDYTLQSPEERTALVTQIIDSTPEDQLTHKYLDVLSNYIIFAMDKQERKENRILTSNHMVTVNKRETSFEGLAESIDGGESSIHSMFANDKNIIFTPKVSITEQDVAEVPGLRELREAIAEVEQQAATATGKRKYALKQQVIQMRQDQYVLKNNWYNRPALTFASGASTFRNLSLDEHVTIDEGGEPHSDAQVTLFNPKHVSALLANYSRLKEELWDAFWADGYYLMLDLDNLIEETLPQDYPMYYDLLIWKIDGVSNEQIQINVSNKYDTSVSIEYISSLWRNKIPKLLSQREKENYVVWYYTNVEPGHWKRCSRCGEYKLAHPYFFSRNGTSKDGYYSLCKECRKKKRQEALGQT